MPRGGVGERDEALVIEDQGLVASARAHSNTCAATLADVKFYLNAHNLRCYSEKTLHEISRAPRIAGTASTDDCTIRVTAPLFSHV